MTGDELDQALAGRDADARQWLAEGDVAAGWICDQLHEDWRSAQSQARRAYAAWNDGDSPDAYAVYLAAQDRADAAQNALARRAG